MCIRDSTWDGTADTDWYKAEETVFDIASAEALAGVSKLAANGETFEGITLRLTRDIDLAGLAWDPIKKFCGIFDGENHKISNMHVEREEGQSGFFEYLNGAQVKNLVLEDAQVVMPDTNSSFYQGVLAGWATTGSEIINCGASGSITADASGSDVPSVSGFIGSCKGDTKLASCWSTVDVETTDSEMACMAGGLVGQWENAANGAQIIDSYFGGSVTVAEATTSAGGILGAGLSFNGNVVLIKGCVSYGSLSTPQNNANAVQIGALDEYGQAEGCLWLDNGQPGVIRLIVDWDTGTAEADPEFDETKCGDKVKEFDEKMYLTMLEDKR